MMREEQTADAGLRLKLPKWWRSGVAWALAVLIFGLSGSAPANACSVVRSYFVPTNFELVQMADAIVIAKVDESLRLSDFFPFRDGQIRFRTIEILKGQPEEVFTGRGYLGWVERSQPVDLSRAHPESYEGPCNRVTFQKGRLYVLFLQAYGDNSKLVPMGYPFARVNEDVVSTNSFWVRVIKNYLDIQSRYAPIEQIEQLRLLADEIRGRKNTKEDSSLLLDIETHLATMSPRKPTRCLLETYRALEKNSGPYPNVLGQWANGEGVSREEIAALARKNSDDITIEDAEAFRRTILWSLAEGPHPEAGDFFDELLRGGEAKYIPPAMEYLRNHGQLERAKQLALQKTDAIFSLRKGSIIHQFVRGLPLDEMPVEYRAALY